MQIKVKEQLFIFHGTFNSHSRDIFFDSQVSHCCLTASEKCFGRNKIYFDGKMMMPYLYYENTPHMSFLLQAH